MARKKGYPGTVSNVSGVSLVGGTMPGVISDGNDSTAVFISRGAGQPALNFTFSNWNLSNRNPTAAQSYNIVLRVRTQLSATAQPGQGGGALYMTISMGGATLKTATVYCPPGMYEFQDDQFLIPNNTTYWNGTAPISIACSFAPTDQSQPSSAYIQEMTMSYGEADHFMDVTANTAYDVYSASANGGVIQNPANAANGTATYATIAPASTELVCDFLARRIPAFSLPVNSIFSGCEVWDILSENAGSPTFTALLQDSFTMQNYPASSPDSSTPGIVLSALADPTAFSQVYPGQTEIVFFLGPGDPITGGVNGWPGVDFTKLSSGQYEFRSQIVTFATLDYEQTRPNPIYMRDLKVRVFYDSKTSAPTGSLSLSEV